MSSHALSPELIALVVAAAVEGGATADSASSAKLDVVVAIKTQSIASALNILSEWRMLMSARFKPRLAYGCPHGYCSVEPQDVAYDSPHETL
jgi:hypothetical protein